MNADPTAFDLDARGDRTDPLSRRISGWTAHGSLKLDMPFITQVADNLWHGGVETGLVLPDTIQHIVALFPWESYTVEHELLSATVVQMYDSLDQGFEQIDYLAQWVNLCRATGPVLVHCQAGLNRSSLVIARALVLAGEFPTHAAAISHMRESRSAAVLCNPAFERWLLAQDPPAPRDPVVIEEPLDLGDWEANE